MEQVSGSITFIPYILLKQCHSLENSRSDGRIFLHLNFKPVGVGMVLVLRIWYRFSNIDVLYIQIPISHLHKLL
jgi:hypothetical protein